MAKSLLSLLEEEFIDENLQYSSFYEENLEFLKTVSLHQVPDDLKLEVASLFLATDDYYACIGFLEDLDVDCITIKRIQFESTASLKPPLYVAFNGVLQDRKSLGDVIEVLCRKQRFDILRHLKEYVGGLLNKYNSLDKIACTDPSPTAPNLSSNLQGNFNHNLNQNNGSCLISCDAFQKEKNKDHKTILNGLQKSKIISPLPIYSNRKQLATAPDIYSSTISVFIMHSMQDRKKAKS